MKWNSIPLSDQNSKEGDQGRVGKPQNGVVLRDIAKQKSNQNDEVERDDRQQSAEKRGLAKRKMIETADLDSVQIFIFWIDSSGVLVGMVATKNSDFKVVFV